MKREDNRMLYRMRAAEVLDDPKSTEAMRVAAEIVLRQIKAPPDYTTMSMPKEKDE